MHEFEPTSKLHYLPAKSEKEKPISDEISTLTSSGSSNNADAVMH